MFADANEIDAGLIGQHSLVDEIADDLRAGKRLAVRPVGDVAEGVETEFDNGSLLWRGALAGGANTPIQSLLATSPRNRSAEPDTGTIPNGRDGSEKQSIIVLRIKTL
jgi:hypothetical protein